MKKQLLFMAVAGLFTTMASAADLIVRDGGAGGAFSTISAAVAQATNGDRIIIRPKTGNLPYQENITIDKSLTFVTEIAGDKYEINGTITIMAANDRVVTIQDAAIVNTNDIAAGSTGALTGRMTINIMNCIVSDDLSFATAGVTANIVGSECDMITMVHGKVVSTLTKKITISDDTSPQSSNDDVYIIGNKVTYPAHGVAETPAVNFSNSKYAFHILNNWINNAAGNGIDIQTIKTGTTNEIANNYIYFSVTNGRGIYVGSGQVATVYILNNAMRNGQVLYMIDAYSTPYVVAQYNICLSSSGSFTVNGLDVANNNSAGIYTFDETTGVATGVVLNAGNPDNVYADTDLTRNDVGPTGGSYAWSNYWTGITNRAHVFFLNTPRTIFNGTTGFSAEGNATTK